MDKLKECNAERIECGYFNTELGHCTRLSRERELEEELRIARSDIQSLKNMIVKMCYDRYGE